VATGILQGRQCPIPNTAPVPIQNPRPRNRAKTTLPETSHPKLANPRGPVGPHPRRQNPQRQIRTEHIPAKLPRNRIISGGAQPQIPGPYHPHPQRLLDPLKMNPRPIHRTGQRPRIDKPLPKQTGIVRLDHPQCPSQRPIRGRMRLAKSKRLGHPKLTAHPGSRHLHPTEHKTPTTTNTRIHTSQNSQGLGASTGQGPPRRLRPPRRTPQRHTQQFGHIILVNQQALQGVAPHRPSLASPSSRTNQTKSQNKGRTGARPQRQQNLAHRRTLRLHNTPRVPTRKKTASPLILPGKHPRIPNPAQIQMAQRTVGKHINLAHRSHIGLLQAGLQQRISLPGHTNRTGNLPGKQNQTPTMTGQSIATPLQRTRQSQNTLPHAVTNPATARHPQPVRHTQTTQSLPQRPAVTITQGGRQKTNTIPKMLPHPLPNTRPQMGRKIQIHVRGSLPPTHKTNEIQPPNHRVNPRNPSQVTQQTRTGTPTTNMGNHRRAPRQNHHLRRKLQLIPKSNPVNFRHLPLQPHPIPGIRKLQIRRRRQNTQNPLR
jgi:hypothetical protein